MRKHALARLAALVVAAMPFAAGLGAHRARHDGERDGHERRAAGPEIRDAHPHDRQAPRAVQVLSRGIVLLCLACAAPAFAGVMPGNWEFTVDVSMSEGGAAGPIVTTRCISEAEARDPQKVLAEAGSSGCAFSNARDTGSEYRFAVDCRGGSVPVHGNGLVRYTSDTLDGVIDLVAERRNLRITTHSKVRARRLGACKS